MTGNLVPLNEFITLQRGHDLPHKDRVEGNIPVVASTGITGYHNVAKAKSPGVVIGRSGSIGGGQYITEDFWPLNTTLWVKDFKGHNERFVYYLLKNIDFTSFNVGSGVPTLNRNHLSSILVENKGRKSEDEIAKILGDFDDKIDLNNQISKNLEKMAQVIFKSWFVDFEPVKAKIAARERWHAIQSGNESASPACYAGELAGQPINIDLDTYMNYAAMQAISGKDAKQLAQMQVEKPEEYAELYATAELFPSAMQDSELGEVPKGWSSVPLSSLFELHRGFDLPQKSREDGLYEIYAAGGLHGTHSEYKMEPPGIITGRSGVIGNVYLSLKKYWPLNTTLYVRQFRLCGPYYAYHLLKTLDLKALNSGSAVPSLNRNFVHSIAVLNPGARALIKFESVASSLFEHIVNNIDQNEDLRVLRDTLLPKLLSGELSVADIESEVEA
ncbi:restriction endonuclease subunit S [Nitrincola tapanii]|uniref:Restriction endonuclease subunit S n=1 Tax=Nitrincola tapanii TaxID=1708751 RepID=A0A5A9W7E5_9GAMM|nr:restriction endonuclease subunit S [Nitrincola tapanii]KAA0876453.1 restriction endonuclease subunit S [Nitrincola tapanii]